MSMNGYYLVRQIISKNIKHSFKVYIPLNIAHLNTLLEHIPGNLYIYLVNPENNSTQNLTNELGRTDFNYSEFRSMNETILKSRLRFSTSQSSWVGDDITFYSVDDPTAFIPKNFFCNNHVTFPYFNWLEPIELTEFENQPEKVYAGTEYEKFIGKKYEAVGYKVEYRGITLGKQDGGIDLIAENDEKIVLVQCKNWIETDNYQIDSRDLRAFIGDCYLYLIQITTKKQVAFHYIISDYQMLAESAKIFLKKQKILQLKETRFEIT